jgi:hypothetical protein
VSAACLGGPAAVPLQAGCQHALRLDRHLHHIRGGAAGVRDQLHVLVGGLLPYHKHDAVNKASQHPPLVTQLQDNREGVGGGKEGGGVCGGGGEGGGRCVCVCGWIMSAARNCTTQGGQCQAAPCGGCQSAAALQTCMCCGAVVSCVMWVWPLGCVVSSLLLLLPPGPQAVC